MEKTINTENRDSGTLSAVHDKGQQEMFVDKQGQPTGLYREYLRHGGCYPFDFLVNPSHHQPRKKVRL